MKILFLSPDQSNRYNRGHQLFRDEFGRQADVTYVGSGYPLNKLDINEILEEISEQPDVILTYGLKYTLPFTGLGDIDIPKAHFICDYLTPVQGFHGYVRPYSSMLQRDKYDMLFVRNSRLQNQFYYDGWADGSVCLLPFSVDTTVYFSDTTVDKNLAVSVCWSTVGSVYPNRGSVAEAIAGLSDDYPIRIGKAYLNDYINVLQRSHISINSNSHWSGVNMKILEAMACGAVCLTDKTIDLSSYFGFVENEHIVYYTTPEDCVDKIDYLMRNQKLCKQIANAGHDIVLKNHSNQKRVSEALEVIQTWML